MPHAYATAIKFKNSTGNCGLEIWGFDQYATTKWTMEALKAIAGGHWPRSVVMFSGNRAQLEHHMSPHDLYKFLKAKGEKIYASPWLDNHTKKAIRVYVWQPSNKIKKQLSQ